MGTKKNLSGPFVFQPFEDLKKIIETRGVKLTVGRIETRQEESSSDEELFVEAMKEVREIEDFRKIPVRHRKSAPIRISQNNSADREALEAVEEIVRGLRPLNLPDTQEYVEWINRDYKGDVLKRLHAGHFSVQDSLDLHGLIVDEAEAEVNDFINESLKKRHRCIKIIHGRGLRSPKGPVLKEALIRWLSGRYRKNVIAFASARQCDGGLGALYVLLR